MNLNTRSATFLLILITSVVFICDVVSKHIAFEKLSHRDRQEEILIDGYLSIRCVKNTGIIWGSFQGMGNLFIVTTSLLLIFICYFYFRLIQRVRDKILTTISFGLISGGGLGNLYDRIYLGYVRDFIDFHITSYKFYWPVFNLADSAICIGTIILFLKIIFSKDFATIKR